MEIDLLISKPVLIDGVYAGKLETIEETESTLNLKVKINKNELEALKEYACINAVIEREND